MEAVKKSPLKPAVRKRTPKEIKIMRFINIFMICFVAALFMGIVLCVINDMGETACLLGFVIIVALWNYRIIRRNYARGF